MTVTIIITSENYVADVAGAGYNAVGEINMHKCDNIELAHTAISNMLEVNTLYKRSLPLEKKIIVNFTLFFLQILGGMCVQ